MIVYQVVGIDPTPQNYEHADVNVYAQWEGAHKRQLEMIERFPYYVWEIRERVYTE
jgi:hypothetical protein